MKGRYDVVLYNNKVHYHLTIKRNITILRGDSASGKSEFIRLLAQYNGSPKSSGISLICDRECIVLNEGNWKLYLETYRERIFFIDEGNDFLRTKEFADAVKGADNYFVIISRENFPNLPYSVDEIYGLREGKYREAKRVYNEMYRIYGNLPDPQQKPEIVITEDSNSGNEFFENDDTYTLSFNVEASSRAYEAYAFNKATAGNNGYGEMEGSGYTASYAFTATESSDKKSFTNITSRYENGSLVYYIPAGKAELTTTAATVRGLMRSSDRCWLWERDGCSLGDACR